MNPAHPGSRTGTQLAFIIMPEETGLVRRHIDLHRTLALTPLARKTQIERFFNRLALPPVCNRFTPNHLAEQTSPAARGMLFLVCDHVAGTHRSTVMTTADTGADTARGRLREAVFVVRILKVCFDSRRIPVAA